MGKLSVESELVNLYISFVIFLILVFFEDFFIFKVREETLCES